MWKQDLGTRVPENYQTELSWRQRCHTDRLIGVSELNRWPNSWWQIVEQKMSTGLPPTSSLRSSTATSYREVRVCGPLLLPNVGSRWSRHNSPRPNRITVALVARRKFGPLYPTGRRINRPRVAWTEVPQMKHLPYIALLRLCRRSHQDVCERNDNVVIVTAVTVV